MIANPMLNKMKKLKILVIDEQLNTVMYEKVRKKRDEHSHVVKITVHKGRHRLGV